MPNLQKLLKEAEAKVKRASKVKIPKTASKLAQLKLQRNALISDLTDKDAVRRRVSFYGARIAETEAQLEHYKKMLGRELDRLENNAQIQADLDKLEARIKELKARPKMTRREARINKARVLKQELEKLERLIENEE